jgi:SAM-dependent methyltransferase/methyltransferase-like protein
VATSNIPTNAYDATPYPDLSYVHTHPDRAATLATLLGLTPAPVPRCRVLEIGCAAGGNLLPLAYALPQARFVGLDYSARQIEEGQARLARLGVRNVQLFCRDLLESSDDLGDFDYVIAHGVYSWVPAAAREALMALIKRVLRPQGVAYVSYNTFPGWHITAIVRDAMLFHARHAQTPEEKAADARTMLDFVAEHATEGAHGGIFRSYRDFLQDGLKGSTDAFLLHDELEETNDPVYFHQFVEHAERHGLQYLVEAELREVLPTIFSKETQQRLQELAGDAIGLEQYMDFLRNRMFRQTLLVHDDVAVQRRLDPSPVARCFVRSQAKPVDDGTPGSAAQFKSKDGATLTMDHPVSLAAMKRVAAAWPRALGFGEVAAAAKQDAAARGVVAPAGGPPDELILAANCLRAYGYSAQLASLHTFQPDFVTEVSERPVASPVARWEAETRSVVTNLWHERVALQPLQAALLMRLDGRHARPELAKATPEIAALSREELELNLRWLAHAALLVG